nr:FHA domain-containing protein [Phycisphaerae bacterium]NIX26481.1 FHA domain-containing protein [Phycisphaerae bacterium]
MNEKPVLIAREGQLTGEKWTVDTENFVIGRGSDCQIILPERQVSRYHARITSENGKFILHDLDSKNGTHLNGVQVKGSTPLRDGDEISIALCVKLLFIGTD